MIRIAPLLLLAGCADLIGITDGRELEMVTLESSVGTLAPPFDPAVTDYDLSLVFANGTATFHAEANDPQATIEVAGMPSVEGSTSVAIPVGDTMVEVVAFTPHDVRVVYRVRVHRPDLAIAFAQPMPINVPVPGMIDRVGVADFDGNGSDDVGVITGFGDMALVINNGFGTLEPRPNMFGGVKAFAARDLDADGKPELIFTAGQLLVARGLGNGNFEGPVAYGASNAPAAFAMLQLDPDGRTDLVLAEQSGRLAVFQGMQMPSPGFAPMPALDQNTGTSPLVFVVSGEFDNMPGDDVASLDPVARKIYIHRNLGGGLGFETVETGPGAMPVELIAADLDGDDREELVWIDRANDSVVVQRFPGPPLAVHVIGGHARSLSAIDVDGDGVRDLLVLDDQGVTVLHNDGTGALTRKSIAMSLPGVQRLAVGDFNGDGRADLVTCNFTSTVLVHLGTP